MVAVEPAELRSFVALGDSFTEGLEDDLGLSGRHRGWADRVAAALAAGNGRVRYANLAIRGRLLDQVIDEQVPVAVQLIPDLISFHAGPNDMLRPKLDLPALLDRYEAAVVRLRATGARVLLFTVIARAGGTGRTADLLAARFQTFNEAARSVARRHDCLLVDLGSPALARGPAASGSGRTRPGGRGGARGTRGGRSGAPRR
jgi:lysophospholipase L1-like esterase